MTAHPLRLLLILGAALGLTSGTLAQTGLAITSVPTDAQILLSAAGTNAAGTARTVTVTVNQNAGSGMQPAAGITVVPTLTYSNGATSQAAAGTCMTGTTNASGQCTITVNSTTAGRVRIRAAATVGSLNRRTGDGLSGDSADATQTYVEARIAFTGGDDTQQVGLPHPFTVLVTQNTGNGLGFLPVSGLNVTATLTPSNGATPDSPTGTCGSIGTVLGLCTITVSSDTPGKALVGATVTLTVSGVSFTRTTGDGLAGDGAKVTETFVDGRVTFSPDATREIGTAHTFTLTAEQNLGNGAWVPAPSARFVVSRTNLNDASAGSATSGCQSSGTDANGHCSITVSSPTTGQVRVHVLSFFWTVSGQLIVRQSGDGNHGDGDNAIASFADGRITIDADSTNAVRDPHTFTVTVTKDVGDGNHFVPADGVVVTPTLTYGNGATSQPAGGTCSTGTNVNGQCTIVVNSSTAGRVTVRGSAALTVGDATITRATGDGLPGDDPDRTKTFVDGQITIDAGAANALGGSHTYTVTVKKDLGDGAGFVAADGVTVVPTLTNTFGATAGAPTGTCVSGTTNASGQCTIIVTSPTPGTVTVHATATQSLGAPAVTVVRATGDALSGDSADATQSFLDAYITLGPASAIELVATPHVFTARVFVNTGAGFVPAPNGTPVTVSQLAGSVGSFTGSPTCTLTSGACTVTTGTGSAGDDVAAPRRPSPSQGSRSRAQRGSREAPCRTARTP